MHGFSLLECLLAMVLSASILFICEAMFVVQHQAGDTVKQEIEQLDRVRQLLLRLGPIVANTGYLGFQSLNSGLPIIVHGHMEGSQMPQRALTIYRARGSGWEPVLPLVLQGKVARGSDVLILERAQPLLSPPRSGWFVMADGTHADIFWQSEGQRPQLNHHYPTHAVLSPWHITAFYLQHTADGLGLMQKSLVPMGDSLNILMDLEMFQCEQEGALLKVSIGYAGEVMVVWLGQ